MNLKGRGGRRHAIAGVVVTLIIFALLFTAGTGYVFFQARSDLSSYQADVQALQQRAQISQEQLTFGVSLSGTSQPVVTVNDTGGFPISVVSAFAEDNTGKVIWGPFTLGALGTSALGPLNLNVGETGSFTMTCASCKYTSGVINIAVVTSRGNVFTRQYPLVSTTKVTTISSATTTTETGPGGGGGNSLVVVMAATPIQVFSGPCPGAQCITDNVTLYNYSPTAMTGAGLHPTVPWSNVTGTAKLLTPSCSGPYTPPGHVSDPTGTIPGYTGVGVAPHIYFLCTYAPQTGAVGGLATFSGWAFANQGSTVVESAGVESNIVQIGGLTNPLAQGAFTTNFFFFKYSSCYQTSGSSFSSPCTKNANPLTIANLPEGAVISGGSNYYVAFYFQITNNYNTTLPLLQYTFLQVDPSSGGETDWWIAGTNASMTNGVYYPNYPSSGTPTLTAYPSDCNNVNSKNVPTDANCIYVDPGKTVTITLAACGFSSPSWDWGGSKRGNSWDFGSSGCISGGSTPSIGSNGDATAATTVISFEYKGAALTEDIAFNGIAFTS